MAFSRLLSSSYHSFMSAVPTFIHRHPVATAAVSLVSISYAAPRLIRYFNTNELNNSSNNDDDDDDLVLFDFAETEESVILRSNLVADNVRKEEIDVCVDHGTLRIEDVLPGRNLFSVTLDLKAKMIENNFIKIVVPKLNNKEEDEDDDVKMLYCIFIECSTVGKYKEASCGLAFVEHNGQTYAPSLPSEMEHNGQTYAPSLPSEILITKIFALFPTITISNTRSWKRVSKGWKFAASHHDYARMQRDRATLGLLFIDSEERDYQGLSNYFLENINLNPNQLLPVYGTPWIDAHTRYKISNSTGGYLGLYNGSARDPVIVCNPIIGEYCRVPGNELNANRVVVALGSHQDRFKLLRFSFGDFIFELDPAVISLFTLGSQNWQVVGVGHNFVYVKPHPVSIDGGIYFLATLETDLPNQLRVVRFNLQTDDFTYLDLPNDPNHPVASFTRDHTSIGIIDGRLYILKCNWQGGVVMHFATELMCLLLPI